MLRGKMMENEDAIRLGDFQWLTKMLHPILTFILWLKKKLKKAFGW